MNLSFQKLFFTLASVFAIFAVLVVAKGILIPLGFAMLISFILYPLTKKLESWGFNDMFAAFLSILTLFLIIGGGIFFFFTQIVHLPTELSVFTDKLLKLFADFVVVLNTKLDLNMDLDSEYLLKQMKGWFKTSAFPVAQNTFYSTSSFLIGIIATIVYTFLILIYRNGLAKALSQFAAVDNRGKAIKMFQNVQKVGQNYLSGMILLIIVLGIANSVGLWIIGIDSPFLFGFLAASLSIIPYIGTTIGASIPVLYAFMSQDSLWIPFAVAVMFWAIQLVESNFLSPKIVGSSLHVNALASILSLIIGASVWGVAGMILFLPFTAMLKVICEEFIPLKPIALLIGSQLYNGREDDIEPMDKWFEKIKKWFVKRKTVSKKQKKGSQSSKL